MRIKNNTGHFTSLLLAFLYCALAIISCTTVEIADLPPPMENTSSSSDGYNAEPASSSSGVPFNRSSSSSQRQSSSSIASSSSSTTPSSSSVTPSSSSVIPSSSSVTPSSSSAVPSSSSITQSSSSVSSDDKCAGFTNGTKRPHYGENKSQFCDERDGKKYVYATIGTQNWMAENLDYNVEGSKCYNNQESNCNTYGRLYNWATAMGIASSYNNTFYSASAKHRGICPSGWHIPSGADWDNLMKYVHADNGLASHTSGTSDYAGEYLKATSGWKNNGNGTDKYGFAALPGGDGDSDGGFKDVENIGYWWSSSENGANYAYYRYMSHGNKYASWYGYYKSYLYSVRCVQD